ncbi:MAG: hypothetical protein JO112_17270 [Planctomycetes bacterium]|nr:hypothetical protein [Planctomycetota bacterium]
MTLSRWILYTHFGLVAACAGFLAWGIGHYAGTDWHWWRFARLVEWLLSLPGAQLAYFLLNLAPVLFPGLLIGAVLNAAREKRVAWPTWGILLADVGLSVVQLWILSFLSPVRY